MTGLLLLLGGLDLHESIAHLFATLFVDNAAHADDVFQRMTELQFKV